jgi:hypothetical protein
MILRKLADAIREQNWVTVILEILIVVVGIFIGLQVDDWNQLRKERQEESEHLVQLTEEARQALNTISRYKQVHRRAIDGGIDLIQGLAVPDYCVDNDFVLFSGMIRITAFPPPKTRFRTVEELSQSGKMRHIQSDDVRQLAIQVRDASDFLHQQWDRYRILKSNLDKEIFALAGFTTSAKVLFGENKQAAPDSIALLTPENLCGNTHLIGLASGEQTSHQSYFRYIEEFEHLLSSYLASLVLYSETGNIP